MRFETNGFTVKSSARSKSIASVGGTIPASTQNRLIQASDLVNNLETMVSKLPSSERQARALSKCADDDETRDQVWSAVVAESGEKPITAAAIARKEQRSIKEREQTFTRMLLNVSNLS